jgi:hypothetical protein
MSIGSLGFAGIGAATPLPQSKGADSDRTAQETTNQQTAHQSDLQAEQAEGVEQTDGNNHETEDRDADGRRPWELPAKKKSQTTTEPAPAEDTTPHSRDATGQCGNSLDLTG